ncbi:MAG: 16S rRNA processing protein RimM [Selenomonadaceae bacterium]|nr:16S rRNA processing protein RimM [Selenomonadaceae bacterium]
MTKLSQSEDKIIIGKLGKTRGLDGTLKIIPLTDFEGRFDELKKIFVGGKIMQVEKVKHIGGEIFIKFFGVDNREFAKTFTNKFLTVEKKDAAPLEDGEFYTFDIIGCEVFDGEKFFGKVENVLKTGSNDVFQVKGEREILIPALKSVVKKIDIANKKISIDSAVFEEF